MAKFQKTYETQTPAAAAGSIVKASEMFTPEDLRRHLKDGIVVAADAPLSQSVEATPTDEELLRDFRSPYRDYPPEAEIKGALNLPRQRAGDLLAKDKEAFLVRKRKQLAAEKAAREYATAQAQLELDRLTRARQYAARGELRTALADYHSWQDREAELQNCLTSHQEELRQARSEHSAEATEKVVQHQLLITALVSQLEEWATRQAEALGALRIAAQAAIAELITLHQHRRSWLIYEAQHAIQSLLDLDHLRVINIFGVSDPKILAESSRTVLQFDRLVDYRSGSYSWNYSPADPQQLLALVETLEGKYQALIPALEQLNTEQN
jgi:hypothetical protein